MFVRRRRRSENTVTQRRPELSKKEYLFAHGYAGLSSEQIHRLQVDDVALFSITPAPIADIMSREIASLKDIHPEKLGRLPVITDGCACVGGNVISFACCKLFSKVIAVEFDEIRKNMLLHNVGVVDEIVRPHMAAVEIYNESYVDAMLRLEQDIVFLDPPWGGPDYKDAALVRLFLGGKHLATIIAALRNTSTKYVVFKAPTNFDIDDMRQQLDAHSLQLTVLTRMHKMDLYSVLLKPVPPPDPRLTPANLYYVSNP